MCLEACAFNLEPFFLRQDVTAVPEPRALSKLWLPPAVALQHRSNFLAPVPHVRHLLIGRKAQPARALPLVRPVNTGTTATTPPPSAIGKHTPSG